MGLTDRLTARAVRRAHVLTVEVPGWWLARAEMERAVRARGWQPATSPADADVLAVCGPPGEALTAAADRVWQQLPGPRARVEVAGSDAASAEAALDQAAELLRTSGATDTPPDHAAPSGSDAHGDGSHGDMDGMDGMDGMDMGHDMEMAPAGIALAEGAEDRDGLEMDVLSVPLGPVLPCWPGGLVLRCRLHGDVVAEAAVEVLPAASPAHRSTSRDDTSTAAARRLDAAGALLELTGWEDAASTARRLRDRLLAGDPPAQVGTATERLRRRVDRSRTLRWALPGEVRERLLAMLDPTGSGAPDEHSVNALPGHVEGLDLAAVRLVVASLALDLSVATHHSRGATDV